MKANLNFEFECMEELALFLDALSKMPHDHEIISAMPKKIDISPDPEALELHIASIKQHSEAIKLQKIAIQDELIKCQNPKCNKNFIPDKKGQNFCSKKCRKDEYSRQFWLTHKKGPNGKTVLKSKEERIIDIKICLQCHHTFPSKRKDQVCCSKLCRTNYNKSKKKVKQNTPPPTVVTVSEGVKMSNEEFHQKLEKLKKENPIPKIERPEIPRG